MSGLDEIETRQSYPTQGRIADWWIRFCYTNQPAGLVLLYVPLIVLTVTAIGLPVAVYGWWGAPLSASNWLGIAMLRHLVHLLGKEET